MVLLYNGLTTNIKIQSSDYGWYTFLVQRLHEKASNFTINLCKYEVSALQAVVTGVFLHPPCQDFEDTSARPTSAVKPLISPICCGCLDFQVVDGSILDILGSLLKQQTGIYHLEEMPDPSTQEREGSKI